MRRRGFDGLALSATALTSTCQGDRHSDVHAWAPGQVVKLFKAGVPRRLNRWEARLTRAVFAAGGPALEVFDEMTLEGRFGMVLSRLDVLQLTRSGAITFGQAGAVLATLALSVHETPPPPDVISLRDSMDGSFLFSGEKQFVCRRHGSKC